MTEKKEKKLYAKKLFDLFFATTGLILLAPFLALAALAIKVDSPGPVFYRGQRVGKNGKLFLIYKFRTMTDQACKEPQRCTTPSSDERITRLGNFLRKSNIDEMPQLINVIKGEMSLVGPRPEIIDIVNLYTKEQKEVLSLIPGLTDYASIEFRREGEITGQSSRPDEEYRKKILKRKLDLQLRYLKEQSLILDIKLIFLTLKSICSDFFRK